MILKLLDERLVGSTTIYTPYSDTFSDLEWWGLQATLDALKTKPGEAIETKGADAPVEEVSNEK